MLEEAWNIQIDVNLTKENGQKIWYKQRISIGCTICECKCINAMRFKSIMRMNVWESVRMNDSAGEINRQFWNDDRKMQKTCFAKYEQNT